MLTEKEYHQLVAAIREYGLKEYELGKRTYARMTGKYVPETENTEAFAVVIKLLSDLVQPYAPDLPIRFSNIRDRRIFRGRS